MTLLNGPDCQKEESDSGGQFNCERFYVKDIHTDHLGLSREVARLIEGYTEDFRAHVERRGYMPDSILHVKLQTAIEAVAMRLTTETIQETIARHVS